MIKPSRLGRAGFSLLELIISLTLSTIVLIGVITLATQLLRNEALTLKSGEVSAQTAASLDAMNRDLEQATYLAPNNPPTTGGNTISFCKNYSAALGTSSPGQAGQIDTTKPILGIYYCVVPGAGTVGNLDTLLRYPRWGAESSCNASNNAGGVWCGCPYNSGTAPSCTLADAGVNADAVVFKNVTKSPASVSSGFYFTRDNTVAGVDIDFVVGFATAVAKGQATASAGYVGLAPAVAYYVDSKITMQKNFLNSSD